MNKEKLLRAYVYSLSPEKVSELAIKIGVDVHASKQHLDNCRRRILNSNKLNLQTIRQSKIKLISNIFFRKINTNTNTNTKFKRNFEILYIYSDYTHLGGYCLHWV